MESIVGMMIVVAAVGVLLTRVNADGQVVARWDTRSNTDGITGAMVTGHGRRNED